MCFGVSNSTCRPKDSDITWLYGPLKPSASNDGTTPGSFLGSSHLFVPNKECGPKSILRKQSVQESLLQGSIYRQVLRQDAKIRLNAQEAKNQWTLGPTMRSSIELDPPSEFVNSLRFNGRKKVSEQSLFGLPSFSRHHKVHFQNEVLQVIAIEAKDRDEEQDYLKVIDVEAIDRRRYPRAMPINNWRVS